MIVATLWLAIVVGSTVAIATHSIALPPVSHGGELAYVRNFDAYSDSGPLVGSPYVSMEMRADRGEVWNYASEGRLGHTLVFEKMSLPGIDLGSRSYVPVAHLDHGMMKAESASGRFLAFSGVNAGFAVQALQPTSVRLLTAADFDIVQTSPSQVDLQLGERAYTLRTMGGGDGIDVNGRIITVTLGAGDELRGYIDSFPATKAVMEDAFDHAWG